MPLRFTAAELAAVAAAWQLPSGLSCSPGWRTGRRANPSGQGEWARHPSSVPSQCSLHACSAAAPPPCRAASPVHVPGGGDPVPVVGVPSAGGDTHVVRRGLPIGAVELDVRRARGRLQDACRARGSRAQTVAAVALSGRPPAAGAAGGSRPSHIGPLEHPRPAHLAGGRWQWRRLGRRPVPGGGAWGGA